MNCMLLYACLCQINVILQALAALSLGKGVILAVSIQETWFCCRLFWLFFFSCNAEKIKALLSSVQVYLHSYDNCSS